MQFSSGHLCETERQLTVTMAINTRVVMTMQNSTLIKLLNLKSKFYQNRMIKKQGEMAYYLGSVVRDLIQM